MRYRNQITVFVVAILVGQTASRADELVTPLDPAQDPLSAAPLDDLQDTGAPIDHETGAYGRATVGVSPYAYNGYAQHRVSPDPGFPGSAAHGLQHYTLPMHAYTTWYRPRAATLTPGVRCAPDPFRPRGFGHLFARPCDGYRMEYSPHVLSGEVSAYGPAYIARRPDPRCPHCDPTAEGHPH